MTNEQRRIKLHDAHVQEWRKWPDTPERFARVLALEASPAFVEYHQLREAREEEIAQSKRQREQARKALRQIQKQFSLAEQNPVLARVIIATFTATPHDSSGRGSSLEPPESTEGLRLCGAVHREGTAEIATMDFGWGRKVSVLKGQPESGPRAYTFPGTYEVLFHNGITAPARVRGWVKGFQVSNTMRYLQRAVTAVKKAEYLDRYFKLHRCCELAEPYDCVCLFACSSPVHGGTHKGTHD